MGACDLKNKRTGVQFQLLAMYTILRQTSFHTDSEFQPVMISGGLGTYTFTYNVIPLKHKNSWQILFQSQIQTSAYFQIFTMINQITYYCCVFLSSTVNQYSIVVKEGQNLLEKPVVMTDPRWPLVDSPGMEFTFKVGLHVCLDLFYFKLTNLHIYLPRCIFSSMVFL